MRFLFFIALFIVTISVTAQSKSERAQLLYQEARDLYRNRNLAAAIDKCEESLSITSTADAYYLSGLIYEAQGKDLRSVSAYEAALKIDPDYNEALFQKAIIYLNYGDPAQSIKDFNALIAKGGVNQTKGIYFENDPSGASGTSVVSLATLEGKIYYYRAQAYSKLERFELALKDYNEAIELDSAADYYVGRGLVYMKQDQNALAEVDFKNAISIDPSNQLAWYNLALINPSTKLPLELLEDHSFAPTLGLLAAQSMVDGDYKTAIKYLSQAIKNHEESLHYTNRGRAYIKLKKYDQARNDFNAARRIEPTRFECLHLIGNTYFFQKNYQLAISFYNQYLTVNPQNAMVWFNAAMSYLELESELDACHYLNRANNLGMVQAKEMIDKYCR